MTGILVAGGIVETSFVETVLREEKQAWVIAIDGGLSILRLLNWIPQEIVGDFDTVSSEVLTWYRQFSQIIWQTHKPEKDATDTELALEAAKQAGCTKIILLGATGGRLDHELSNIQLLNLYSKDAMQVEILDEKNRITLLRAEESVLAKRVFCKNKLYGKYVSFVPLSETVSGITLTGFKYPLMKKDITIGSSLCISNEVVEEEATITFDKGILLCIEARD